MVRRARIGCRHLFLSFNTITATATVPARLLRQGARVVEGRLGAAGDLEEAVVERHGEELAHQERAVVRGRA